jgi:hypothetical protein
LFQKTQHRLISSPWSQAPSGVDDHISKGGRVLLMQSTLSNVEETVSKMERKELATKVKKSIDVGFFETIVLIEAIHN